MRLGGNPSDLSCEELDGNVLTNEKVFQKREIKVAIQNLKVWKNADMTILQRRCYKPEV